MTITQKEINDTVSKAKELLGFRKMFGFQGTPSGTLKEDLLREYTEQVQKYAYITASGTSNPIINDSRHTQLFLDSLAKQLESNINTDTKDRFTLKDSAPARTIVEEALKKTTLRLQLRHKIAPASDLLYELTHEISATNKYVDEALSTSTNPRNPASGDVINKKLARVMAQFPEQNFHEILKDSLRDNRLEESRSANDAANKISNAIKTAAAKLTSPSRDSQSSLTVYKDKSTQENTPPSKINQHSTATSRGQKRPLEISESSVNQKSHKPFRDRIGNTLERINQHTTSDSVRGR